MPISNTLAEARGRKDMTQEQLSLASGVPLSSIQKYERGANEPTVGAALALCTALGMNVEQVFLPNFNQEILNPHPTEEAV